MALWPTRLHTMECGETQLAATHLTQRITPTFSHKEPLPTNAHNASWLMNIFHSLSPVPKYVAFLAPLIAASYHG